MDKKIDRKALESGSIFRSLIQGQVEGDFSCSNHKFRSHLEGRSFEKQVDASPEGIASSNEFVRDHSSLLSLQPWIFRKEICQDDEDKMKVNGNFSDRLNRLADASQAELSPRNVNLGYGRGRGRSSLRSRRSHRHSVKPVTSVGNCLIPQLYNEHFDLEEYVLSSMQSSVAPIVRPLIITDGNRIISRSTYDTLGVSSKGELLKEVDGMTSREMETVIGVPPLPQFRSPKQNSRECPHRNLEASNSRRTCKVSNSPGKPAPFFFLLEHDIIQFTLLILNSAEHLV